MAVAPNKWHHHQMADMDVDAHTGANNKNNNEERQRWWRPTNGVTTKPLTWHVTGGFQDNECPSREDPTTRDADTTPTTNGAHGETATPTHSRQPHHPPTLSPPPTHDNAAHEHEHPHATMTTIPPPDTNATMTERPPSPPSSVNGR
ncbi:hypothetical protein K443DRAFT_4840 [Laccaria amethystina LaAM-08-1]|uniref:Uncharacterized protein n=1 Tax=Laccaria amethystina LaAM-08-1 TaxID=1095629 RepID=A0A0C9WWV6_9AGAR|nr:hypothetical protein K443DRAFT_4840 [Laccaria amethystina LaAM-08-1]